MPVVPCRGDAIHGANSLNMDMRVGMAKNKVWKKGKEYKISALKNEGAGTASLWLGLIYGGYILDNGRHSIFITFSQAKKLAKRFAKDLMDV